MSYTYRETVVRTTPVVLIGGLGVTLLVAAALYLWQHRPTVPSTAVVIGFVFALVVVASGALLYASLRLARTQLDSQKRWWASLWTLLGFAGIVAIVALAQGWRSLHQSMDPTVMLGELLLAGTAGSVAGLLIGISTVDSMASDEAAERQRDGLVFVNRVLRHNVRNSIQVIQSYADLVESETAEDTAARHSELIAERARHLNTVIDEAQTLTASLSGGLYLAPTDISATLRCVVEARAEASPEATFRTDIEDDLSVRADSLIDAIFENVLSNAVEHHDGTPTVTVTAKRTVGEVVVRIADDGPSIPSEKRESYFQPGTRTPDSDGEGFGLYLVRTLVTRYNGEVTIEDNEPRGTVVTVRLPAA
ncbi:MAG: ATP-binding protein [Natronomonas sp.]